MATVPSLLSSSITISLEKLGVIHKESKKIKAGKKDRRFE